MRTYSIKLYKGEGNMHSRNVLNAVRAQLVIANRTTIYADDTAEAVEARQEATRIGLTFIVNAGPADMNTIHRIAKLLRGDIKP